MREPGARAPCRIRAACWPPACLRRGAQNALFWLCCWRRTFPRPQPPVICGICGPARAGSGLPWSGQVAGSVSARWRDRHSGGAGHGDRSPAAGVRGRRSQPRRRQGWA